MENIFYVCLYILQGFQFLERERNKLKNCNVIEGRKIFSREFRSVLANEIYTYIHVYRGWTVSHAGVYGNIIRCRAYPLFISCSTVKGSDPRSRPRIVYVWTHRARLAARRQSGTKHSPTFSYISQLAVLRYVANTYAARMQSSARGHRPFRKRDAWSWPVFLK